MTFDEPKLKKVCISVLRMHIGLAAYPITNEIVPLYAQDISSTLMAAYSIEHMSNVMQTLLVKRLPAKLPVSEIADSIARKYHTQI